MGQEDHNRCWHGLEVYVDNFMSIVIPTSRDQLEHVATAVMTGIHNMFPTNIIDGDEPISEKIWKVRGSTPLSKHSLGLSSMAITKKCGWRRKNGQNSSPLYLAGSGRAVLAGGVPF
jgi:hypothetical protein